MPQDMGSKTYIVDTSTLIEEIYEIKGWVYSGFAGLLVPRSTLEQVEKAAEAALNPKSTPKEPNPKRSSGRASRRGEQPLFDANPRVAREFLKRAQEGHLERVILQLPGEEFTQWKEEEEKEAAKSESPVAPPSSFADALLRKSNLSNGGDVEAKGPSKPRLVARSTEPKSPWSYHKVPKISVREVPEIQKDLMSCALWRLHEFGNNPMAPETFLLLTGNFQTVAAAKKLGVPTASPSSIRAELAEDCEQRDQRNELGQLEADFPDLVTRASSEATDTSGAPEELGDDGNLVINGDKILTAEDDLDDEELKELNDALAATVHAPKPELASFLSSVDQAILQSPTHPEHPPGLPRLQGPTGDLKVTEDSVRRHTAGMPVPEAKILFTKTATPPSTRPSTKQASSPMLVAGPQRSAAHVKDDESEIGSDEEIILFKPRAQRNSGMTRKSADVPRSRPSTAHGLNRQPVQADAPVAPIKETTEGPSHPEFATLKPKPPLASVLKPQSPVFTPGQIYKPAPSPVEPQSSPVAAAAAPAVNGHARSKSPPPIHARAGNASRPLPVHHRRHSPEAPLADARRQTEIIQRQRQAIQRQAKATASTGGATGGRTVSPPREVHMEPTANPTVIDPDAFDRSYVVHPPSSPAPNAAANSGKRRSGGGGGKRRSPKNSPRGGSPKRAAPAAGADVDFVLKSGAPRGSTRGRGKLWVP